MKTRNWIQNVVALSVLVSALGCGSERERMTALPGRSDASVTDSGRPVDAGSDAGVVTDAGQPADAGQDAGMETEPADLGKGCPGGCNLATCVLENSDCEGGVCVWHGALGAAYCSRTCVTSCVPGYSCVRTEDDYGEVCLSDTPVCGNNTIEYGEVCDDGNTDAGDLCSPGCTMITQLPSGGTVITSFDGREPMTAMGNEPVVEAHLVRGRLFFNANTSGTNYAFNIAEEDGPAPYTTLMEIGLSENVGGNLCVYSAATLVNIERFDYAAQEVAGNAGFIMVCTGGGCEFGCNREFTLDVQFDLNWVQRE